MVSFAPFCFPASVCRLNVLMIMIGPVIYVLSEMSAVLQCCSAAGPVQGQWLRPAIYQHQPPT